MENKRKKLLYISSNDGSDMRINKELQTLAECFDITYVGVGNTNIDSFASDHCKLFYLVIGKRNHVFTIVRQFLLVFRLLFKKYHSIHVINEQLMIFFYPLFIGKYLVLDIFDSIFLTLNKGKNRWAFLKRIIYAPVNRILVTDENRRTLMPDFLQNRILVLENYPYKYTGSYIKNNIQADQITILYNGWMGLNRGTDIIEKILSVNNNVKIIMAGWFADERTKILQNHPQVDYRGIMTQAEALHIAATEADYILCVYAPVNENNINASPNKIYDSIQARTPVIINSEIKIASFVKEKEIGLIIDDYDIPDINKFIQQMIDNKNKYHFSNELVETYTWQNIEHILTQAHKA